MKLEIMLPYCQIDITLEKVFFDKFIYWNWYPFIAKLLLWVICATGKSVSFQMIKMSHIFMHAYMYIFICYIFKDI